MATQETHADANGHTARSFAMRVALREALLDCIQHRDDELEAAVAKAAGSDLPIVIHDPTHTSGELAMTEAELESMEWVFEEEGIAPHLTCKRMTTYLDDMRHWCIKFTIAWKALQKVGEAEDGDEEKAPPKAPCDLGNGKMAYDSRQQGFLMYKGAPENTCIYWVATEARHDPPKYTVARVFTGPEGARHCRYERRTPKPDGGTTIIHLSHKRYLADIKKGEIELVSEAVERQQAQRRALSGDRSADEYHL